jgi:hypothetical protein
MRMQLRAGAIALALVGSVGFAAAQSSPGAGNPGSSQEKFNLSPSQEQSITQQLSKEPTQNVPGFQGQVGSKLPDSANAQRLPAAAQAQVPEAKAYLFVKLPDRIVLIDPETKLVAEIIGASPTTGSASPSGANPGSPSR